MWGKYYRLIRFDWPLHFVLLFTNWLPDNVIFLNIRGWLASFFIGKCGKNFSMGRNITIYNPSKVTIGNNVYIASGCWFLGTYGIHIEDNVLFGPNVVIVTSNHSIKNGAYFFGEGVKKEKVTISQGSWIGANATILPGTFINQTVLVAANSAIKGQTLAFGIYGGVPAKFIAFAKPND